MMFAALKSRFGRHRDTVLYTISNMVLAGATFLGSFVCARLLAPAELGAFQTAMLLVTYSTFLPLGVVNGFNREYPFLLGKRDHESARRLAQTGYTVTKTAALVAALLALGQFWFFSRETDNPTLVLAAAAIVPIVAASQINALQRAILTGRQEFSWLARVQFIGALTTLGFLVAVWLWGPNGQALRLIAVALVAWFLFLPKTKEARVWHWDGKLILGLIKTGLPILAIGYMYQVFSVADRTLVAWVQGTEAVGHYALAGLAIAAIQSVYTPLAVATYSKANHAFGRTQSVASLIGPLKKFVLLLTFTVVPLACVIYLLLPWGVKWLLPNYVAGIRAGQIACIASVAVCYCGTGFVFNVTGHNRIYGLMWAVAVGCFFSTGILMPSDRLTLESVAWLRTAISIGICVLCNLYLLLYIRTRMKLE